MAAGMAAADALASACRTAGSSPAVDIGIDSYGVEAKLPARALLALLPLLEDAARNGHRAVVTVNEPDASLQVTWTSTGRAAVDVVGSTRDLLVSERSVELDGAVTRGDAAAAIALLGDAIAGVELVLRPEASQGHWVPSVALLVDHLGSGRWGSTLRRLRPGPGLGQALVIVQDADRDILMTPALLFAGPAADLTGRQLAGATEPLPGSYRQVRLATGAPSLPSPEDLVPIAGGGVLAPLRPVLEAAARAAAWYWLSHAPAVGLNEVTGRFDGVRVVDLSLRPFGAGAPADELALFAWATAVVDPARDDALHQAVTFAVRDAADLEGAAAAVLRTARSLHELAGRGAVAEALAARRGARESAITVARAAALSARDVAARAVERTLALLVAGALAVFANGRDLLSTDAAVAVVVAAAALAVVALAVADRVELESGSRLLNAFDKDIELYREALSVDDLAAVRNLEAVKAARTDLSRSRTSIRCVYGGVAALILVGGLFVVDLQSKDAAKPTPEVSSSPVP